MYQQYLIGSIILRYQLNSHIFFDSEKQVPVKSLQTEKSVFPALSKVLGHDMINFKIITRIAWTRIQPFVIHFWTKLVSLSQFDHYVWLLFKSLYDWVVCLMFCWLWFINFFVMLKQTCNHFFFCFTHIIYFINTSLINTNFTQ